MARSTQQQLDACDARIEIIETTGTQEYTYAERRRRDAELETLYKERARLEAKLGNEGNGGSMASLGQIDRPN